MIIIFKKKKRSTINSRKFYIALSIRKGIYCKYMWATALDKLTASLTQLCPEEVKSLEIS